MLHTKHLRPFLAVVRHGNLSRASEELLRAQSAVSRSINELEAALGVSLFERNPRRWLLTDFGQALLRRVEQAFAEMQEACDILCSHYPGSAPRLRTAPFFSFGVHERRLELMFEFAQRKHISVAAAAVGVSQPAASMALHDLEASVGVPLFDRAHSGVALNEAGMLLLAHVKRALAQLRMARTEISALQGVIEGQVIVGALPFSRSFVLPAAIGHLLTQYPRLRVRTVEGPLESLTSSLRLGDVDFLVGALPPEPAGQGLVLEPLVEQPLTVLARRNHPLARQASLTMADALQASWVLPCQGTPTRDVLNAWLGQNGLGEPHVAVESSDLSIIRGLLLQTDMISAASRQLFLHELKTGALVSLPLFLPGTERPIGILRRTLEHSSPGAQLLIEEIRRVSIAEARPSGAAPETAEPHANTDTLA